MKHFLIIFAITACVWVGVSMSEKNDYPMLVRVEMTGYDTVRYAVLKADTAIDVSVTCSGFDAFLHSIRHSAPVVKIAMTDTGLYRTVAFDDVQTTFRQSIMGAGKVTTTTDTLRLLLAERNHRTLRPKIEPLQISFAEGYGLYGEPTMVPSEVTLYGPEEVLRSIEELPLEATVITSVDNTTTLTIPLSPVWEKYHDVKASVKSVQVTIPVESYVECDYMVPVEISGADSSVRIKVYPDVVTVHAWVARRDMPHVSAQQFSVGIAYDELLGDRQRHKLRLSRFPDHVRLRSIEPDEVQCVILK